MKQISQKMQQLPQNQSLFGDVNYNTFYAAAIKPLPYAAITAVEQLMFDDSQQKKLAEQREAMDEACTLLSI